MLDLQELKRAREHGLFSIGSHCRTHPDLPRLDEPEARDEIFGSKNELESMLQEGIQSLSFPFGSFNETHVRMAREAGYHRVFSTSPDLFRGNGRRKYVVGRVKADPEDWPLEFRLKILGAYRWLPLAFSIKRKVRSFLSFGSHLRTRIEVGH
jgi:peptidoglycan/xylan/chitin deacetylase (PgdA/CDA1 family)